VPGSVSRSPRASSKRKALPGADELFRSTSQAPASEAGDLDAAGLSGRVKHDEKITVYVTADELFAMEGARLKVRAEVGRSVDRGRFVRAALSIAMDDLENRGADSEIVRRIADSLEDR
jgi:hypothetical protein